jgi:hypothetical protein
VVGLTTSASNRDLHEVLHEDLIGCQFVNHVHPGDTVSCACFVCVCLCFCVFLFVFLPIAPATHTCVIFTLMYIYMFQSFIHFTYFKTTHTKVGAITFIQKVEENVGGDLESIFIRTIGVKNIHGNVFHFS